MSAPVCGRCTNFEAPDKGHYFGRCKRDDAKVGTYDYCTAFERIEAQPSTPKPVVAQKPESVNINATIRAALHHLDRMEPGNVAHQKAQVAHLLRSLLPEDTVRPDA